MGKYIWYEGKKRLTTPEYRAWQSMKGRCFNKRSKDYKYYGGRGITVCAAWRESFESFLYDMGERPTSLHTLERKKVNKGYDKANCIWATREMQAQNRNYCTMTKKIAKAIRVAYANGLGDQNILAKKFKSTQAGISQITRGVAWKNAGGPILKSSVQYRNSKGANNANAKLTEKEVSSIKKLYSSGKYTQKELGQRFSVGQAHISRIILGIVW